MATSLPNLDKLGPIGKLGLILQSYGNPNAVSDYVNLVDQQNRQQQIGDVFGAMNPSLPEGVAGPVPAPIDAQTALQRLAAISPEQYGPLYLRDATQQNKPVSRFGNSADGRALDILVNSLPPEAQEAATLELARQRAARESRVVDETGASRAIPGYDLSALERIASLPQGVLFGQQQQSNEMLQPPVFEQQPAQVRPETVAGLRPLQASIANELASARTAGRITDTARRQAMEETAVSGFTSSEQARDSMRSLAAIVSEELNTVNQALQGDNTPSSRQKLLASKRSYESTLQKIAQMNNVIEENPTLFGTVGTGRGLLETISGSLRDVSDAVPVLSNIMGGLTNNASRLTNSIQNAAPQQEQGAVDWQEYFR